MQYLNNTDSTYFFIQSLFASSSISISIGDTPTSTQSIHQCLRRQALFSQYDRNTSLLGEMTRLDSTFARRITTLYLDTITTRRRRIEYFWCHLTGRATQNISPAVSVTVSVSVSISVSVLTLVAASTSALSVVVISSHILTTVIATVTVATTRTTQPNETTGAAVKRAGTGTGRFCEWITSIVRQLVPQPFVRCPSDLPHHLVDC